MNLRLFDMQLLRQFRPRIAYLGDHTALASTRLGHKIYVDTRDISLAPHVLLDGAWENWLARVMIANFPKGGVMLDAGANIGYHTLLMAEIAGPSGCVHAVEANPRLASLVERTLSINGFRERAPVHGVALGPESGEVELKIFQKYLGSSSLVATDEAAAHFGDSLTRVTVPMKTVDELLAGRPLNAAKIDCEGAEPGILFGARETLARSNDLVMVMEYSPAMYPSDGTVPKMIDLLLDQKFQAYAISHGGGFSPMTRDALLNYSGQMDVMLAKGRAPVSAERTGTGLVAPFIRLFKRLRGG